jgi:hypothetical protein
MNDHTSVDSLVEKTVLGTLLSIQRLSSRMSKTEFDRWLDGQIDDVAAVVAGRERELIPA